MTNVVIVSAARTAVGSFNGAFANTPAHELGAAVIAEVVARAGIDKADVDETILGQVLTAGQGQNPARQAHILAGLPQESSAWSLNQVCGSGLRAVALAAQHIQLGDAAIVIAGGGMCSGGRIVNYLEAMLDEPRHNVLFVGYQAQGTLGSRIQKYGPSGGYVEINQRRIEIRAGISTLGGYSAHADQASLLRFITGMRKWPQEVRLIHGEAQAKTALQKKIKQAFADRQHVGEVSIPD